MDLMVKYGWLFIGIFIKIIMLQVGVKRMDIPHLMLVLIQLKEIPVVAVLMIVVLVLVMVTYLF